jgi:hypothetical protein
MSLHYMIFLDLEVFKYIYIYIWAIQGVPGVKINILGGHSIGHSKEKKSLYECALFRTVSDTRCAVF